MIDKSYFYIYFTLINHNLDNNKKILKISNINRNIRSFYGSSIRQIILILYKQLRFKN